MSLYNVLSTIPWVRALAVWLLFAAAAAHATDRPALSFAIVPQQAAGRLVELWTPILAYLKDKTGLALHLETTRDIPTFERRLAAGEYDFAYMNPYHYTVFQNRAGYRAFARENIQLVGLMVTRADGPVRSLDALAGTTLVFPSTAALAASALTRAHLRSLGIAFTPKYVASHDSVYLAVVSGSYPAGGGIERTFDNLPPELRRQLRVLWRSPPYPPHAFAAHRRVPAASVRRLQAAMVAMGTDPRGRALLGTLSMSGLVTARDDDWDQIRNLGLKLLGHELEGGPQ